MNNNPSEDNNHERKRKRKQGDDQGRDHGNPTGPGGRQDQGTDQGADQGKAQGRDQNSTRYSDDVDRFLASLEPPKLPSQHPALILGPPPAGMSPEQLTLAQYQPQNKIPRKPLPSVTTQPAATMPSQPSKPMLPPAGQQQQELVLHQAPTSSRSHPTNTPPGYQLFTADTHKLTPTGSVINKATQNVEQSKSVFIDGSTAAWNGGTANTAEQDVKDGVTFVRQFMQSARRPPPAIRS